MRSSPLWLVVFSGMGAALLSAQPASVEESARKILGARCASCHGAAKMSELDVRESATLLKGGTRGPAIVPHKAAESLLFKAVKREGDLQMPPGKTPLPAAEVEILRAWIDGGATWDANTKTIQQPSWWSFKKPEQPPVPAAKNAWVRNPIDAFILAKLDKEGLRPAPAADRRTLVRRAYFDLHGLPPTPKEVDEFLSDKSDNAYEKLIDRLLASPRYGERWGRYWLDLVRYADTSGFETDHFFPTAWRYRDYVINSFNTDKPYNTFVQEQIAADEIWPDNLELEGTSLLSKKKIENVNRRIGTSLFTLGSFPIEFTYYADQYRAEWQGDAVDTLGAAFLGLTLGCARCHDHKFDPIRQRDYYSFAAFFAGSEEREIPLVSQFDVLQYTRAMPLISQVESLKQMARQRGGMRGRKGDTAEKKDGTEAVETGEATASAPPPPKTASPYPPAERAALMQRIGELYTRLPNHFPTAHVLAHQETIPDTHILNRGEYKNKGQKVEPAFPPALNPGPAINEPSGGLFVPQRRKALALWLTSPDHPLVNRVMVNRIWQGHFGTGIVATPNDFGRQGDAPTHPELLDWLATKFVQDGSSIKQMHRLIMLSNTYQQSSTADAGNLEKDPENHFLGRMNRRRLDGDGIRDTILDVAGTLNLKMGGMGIIPPLSKEELQAARMPDMWPANPDPSEYTRRTIYLQMKRSMTLPMLQTFDAPDTATSCARRDVSTVAPQALTLLNGPFSLEQAQKFAARLQKENGDDPEKIVNNGWLLAFGRLPADKERTSAMDYLKRNSLPRLCLLMFNMSEFIYVD